MATFFFLNKSYKHVFSGSLLHLNQTQHVETYTMLYLAIARVAYRGKGSLADVKYVG